MRYLVIASHSLSSISLKVELPPFKVLFPKVRLLFYLFDYINYKNNKYGKNLKKKLKHILAIVLQVLAK